MSLQIYWERIHEVFGREEEGTNLASVCCPQAPQIYNQMVDAFQRRTVVRLLDGLESLDGKRVIDVGCGAGRWTRLLDRCGCSVIGIDLAYAALKRVAKQHAGADFVQMNATQLALRDQSLDGTVSVTVLQHLPYPSQAAAVRELGRCTRPGGFSLILEHTHRNGDGASSPSATTFPNTEAEWIELFRQNGFALCSTDPCLILPLFRAYWQVRDTFRAKRYAQYSAPGSGDHKVAALPTPNGFLGRLNWLIYALLTPPSYVVEWLIDTVGPLRRLVSRRLPVTHRGFLFQKQALT